MRITTSMRLRTLLLAVGLLASASASGGWSLWSCCWPSARPGKDADAYDEVIDVEASAAPAREIEFADVAQRIKWQLQGTPDQPSPRPANKYPRVITISDVHGNLKALESVWARLCSPEVFGSEEVLKKSIIVFLGDINDRGPNTRGAIDFILNKRAQGFDVRCIAGNHDFSMASFVGGDRFLATLKYKGVPGGIPELTYPGPFSSKRGVYPRHPTGLPSVDGDCYQADYNEPEGSELHVVRGREDAMHFLGRKWAVAPVFGSDKTLLSYAGEWAEFASSTAKEMWVDQIFKGRAKDELPRGAAARKDFVRNVPDAHKEFLMELPLIEEIKVADEQKTRWWTQPDLEKQAPGLFPKDLNKTRRFIAVHAGIMADRPAEPQITALKEREVYDRILHPYVHEDGSEIENKEECRRWNLILPITGRMYFDKAGELEQLEKGGPYIELLHEDLAEDSIVVSGHHGKKVNALGINNRPGELTWRRCISDKSGGRCVERHAMKEEELKSVAEKQYTVVFGGEEGVIVGDRTDKTKFEFKSTNTGEKRLVTAKDLASENYTVLGHTTIEAVVWPDKFIIPDSLPTNHYSALEVSNEGMERGRVIAVPTEADAAGCAIA